LEFRSQPDSLRVSPIVEQRFADLEAFEKSAAVQVDGSGNIVSLERRDECIAIDPKRVWRAEDDAIAIRRNEVLAERGSETMQCLAKGVSRVGLGDFAPEEVDELFTASFSSNSEVSEEASGFPGPRPVIACPSSVEIDGKPISRSLNRPLSGTVGYSA
jgi:hypothetical protein